MYILTRVLEKVHSVYTIYSVSPPIRVGNAIEALRDREPRSRTLAAINGDQRETPRDVGFVATCSRCLFDYRFP